MELSNFKKAKLIIDENERLSSFLQNTKIGLSEIHRKCPHGLICDFEKMKNDLITSLELKVKERVAILSEKLEKI